MKNSFCIIVYWTVMLASVLTGCQSATTASSPGTDPAELALLISLDKSTYEPDEVVSSKIILRNDGDQPVLVNKRLNCNVRRKVTGPPNPFGEIGFQVIAPSGQELSFLSKINTGFPKLKHFIELQPGEFVDNVCLISGHYHLAQEGIYSIQAFYENQFDPASKDTSAWKGQLSSEVITFSIVTSN